MFEPKVGGPDDVTKGLSLLTRGLPKLVQTSKLDGSTARAEAHHVSPGPNRWKERSRTRPAVANAFAEQWSRKELK